MSVDRPRRQGFTLIEVSLALAISGLAILGSILLLDQLDDSARRIALLSTRSASDGNGVRLLERLLLDAASLTDSAHALRGDEHSVELSTTCVVPGGWKEACRINLTIDQRGDTSIVSGAVPGQPPSRLRAFPRNVEFRYRDVAHPDSAWVQRWTSSSLYPPAIAVTDGRDTTILLVGAR